MSKITNSAKGEQCTVNIPGVCKWESETVIWAHLDKSIAGKGMSKKANDLFGAYCCHLCHAAIHNPSSFDFTKQEVELWHMEGMVKSQIILEKKGLIKVAQ